MPSRDGSNGRTQLFFFFFFFARDAGKLSRTYLYVYLNIGSVMAEDALYCMRVVWTQISLRHSADCLGSLLFVFVWFCKCTTGGDSEQTILVWVPT